MDGVRALRLSKISFNYDSGLPLLWIPIIVLITIAPNAVAQLISIERSVSTRESYASSTGNDEVDRCLPDLHVQSAGFTTTEPQKLFADNVVYVDPSQEPLDAEPNNVLPPELSIPPMSEEPLELPITNQPFEPPTSNSSGCTAESIHNFIVPDEDGKRLRFSRLMQEP